MTCGLFLLIDYSYIYFTDCSTQSKHDVIFVVDESGSVGAANFQKTKDAIKKVLVSLDIDSGLIRVGILCYSSSNRIIFHLEDHDSDLASALTAVDNIVYQKGGTYIATAMKKARQDMFVSNKGDRTDASNIMVVMTDGISYDDYSEEDEANLCRAAGIKVASVAIGSNLDETMLRNIAYSESWYLQTDFDSLGDDFVTLMEALGPCPSGIQCKIIFSKYNIAIVPETCMSCPCCKFIRC
ncbi:hypothetical protein FSP39_008672 [Pinctada imbricata]|uniref:VWFA domain-containing protein n=1 Tax=Pinctada imbricata TaxID=66713 RepID=A0AA89BX29_PINIB|nr:hypothetical protein FSP39_008672 [Pinctada imbricata]